MEKEEGRENKFKACALKLLNRWFIEAFSGMAQGLFVTLIAGLIIKQIGIYIGENKFGLSLVAIGSIAMILTGAGIGGGIAHALKANKLVIFASMVAGMVGANAAAFNAEVLNPDNTIATIAAMIPLKGGDPIGAYVAALVAAEIGILLTGKTKGLDIIVLPLSVILTGLVITIFICPFIIDAINALSRAIFTATELKPFLMGIVISVVVGVLLTMPTSSAAICISLGLGGIVGGAAVVGCAAHMVGFAVMSFRENKFGGLIAQGLGTSMLQIPNVMRKPVLLVPPIIASAIAGPLATVVFKLECTPAGSGMGTSGLVGVLQTIEASKSVMGAGKLAFAVILLLFVMPAAICLLVSEIMRKYNIIKYGDLKL
jgi:uncharacterized membrane protein